MVKQHMAFQPHSCQGAKLQPKLQQVSAPDSLQLPNSRAHPCVRARSVQLKRLFIEPEGLFPLMFPFKRQLFLKMGPSGSLQDHSLIWAEGNSLSTCLRLCHQRPWQGWGHAELCWAKTLPSPSGGGSCTLQCEPRATPVQSPGGSPSASLPLWRLQDNPGSSQPNSSSQPPSVATTSFPHPAPSD